MKIKKLRIPSPPAAAVLAAAVVFIITLFLPPVVGMADNGDYYRIISGNGLYKLDQYEDDQYLQYFSTQFGRYQYFNENTNRIFSSQTPFIQAAMALDRLFTGNDGLFDIRFLALILAAWTLVGLYGLVDYASWGIPAKYGYFSAALGVFLFADTGYAAYFNSFYTEAIVIPAFFNGMACALLIGQKRYPPFLLWAGFLLNGVLLVTAKQQNAPLGFLLAGLGAVLLALNWKEAASPKKLIAAASSIVGSLCAAGIAVYLLIPQEFVNINQYHAMTRGMLMTSENPEDTLEGFGINPQFSLLERSIYYDRYPVADVESQELKDYFYPKYGFVQVAAYYLIHPDQLIQMLDIAAQNAYSIRPESIGNFQRSAGNEPGEKSYRFALYSTLASRFIPRTVGFAVIWIAVMLGFSFKDRWRLAVLAFAILMGLSQIGVSIIGAGDADLSKHIFLYNLSFDFVNFTMISSGLIHRRGLKKQQSLPVPAASGGKEVQL